MISKTDLLYCPECGVFAPSASFAGRGICEVCYYFNHLNYIDTFNITGGPPPDDDIDTDDDPWGLFG